MAFSDASMIRSDFSWSVDNVVFVEAVISLLTNTTKSDNSWFIRRCPMKALKPDRPNRDQTPVAVRMGRLQAQFTRVVCRILCGGGVLDPKFA